MRKSKMTRQKLEKQIFEKFEEIIELCKEYDDINYLSLYFSDGNLGINNNYYDEDVKKINAYKKIGEKKIFRF